LRITALTYGPHGVGRLNGKVMFVRGVLPGEDVDVRVREERRSFAYADLLSVKNPSPDRRVPPCPYLPQCGGCPWQHIRYDAQLRAKEQNVRDQLHKIGHLEDIPLLSTLPSPLEFGYRSRLNLRVEDRRVGFYAAGSHSLVPIDHCLLAEDTVDAAIRSAASLVGRLASRVRRVEIVERGAGGVVLRGEVQGRLADADRGVVGRWLASKEGVDGLVLHGRGWRLVWGTERIRFSPEENLDVDVRCGAFTQVNPAANRLLVRTVLKLGKFRSTDRVLDLYAGAGNFGFAVARRVADVVVVEQDALTAEDAAAAAAALGFDHVEVWRCSAAQALTRALADRATFDTVILDPPRSGAAEVLDGLLDAAPSRLIYVSCNPATLGRDLGRLSARYRIEAVQPIDLFPQSYHVECVVSAVLTC
jgi:23S rRNA (uracil1939-C5)-methyltransferase